MWPLLPRARESSHHPQEILLAQFSLYVHKGGLKPDSFHFPRARDYDFVDFRRVEMNRALGHLCAHYRLNWARRTSWGWWEEWDDTVLQTQDSTFEPWRSETEHATSRSRRLATILSFIRGWGRNIFVSFKPPRPATEHGNLAWKAAVLTTTLGPPPPSRRKLSSRLNMFRLIPGRW